MCNIDNRNVFKILPLSSTLCLCRYLSRGGHLFAILRMVTQAAQKGFSLRGFPAVKNCTVDPTRLSTIRRISIFSVYLYFGLLSPALSSSMAL